MYKLWQRGEQFNEILIGCNIWRTFFATSKLSYLIGVFLLQWCKTFSHSSFLCICLLCVRNIERVFFSFLQFGLTGHDLDYSLRKYFHYCCQFVVWHPFTRKKILKANTWLSSCAQCARPDYKSMDVIKLFNITLSTLVS